MLETRVRAGTYHRRKLNVLQTRCPIRPEFQQQKRKYFDSAHVKKAFWFQQISCSAYVDNKKNGSNELRLVTRVFPKYADSHISPHAVVDLVLLKREANFSYGSSE